MRKIESQMCQAVQSSKNWQSANTTVHFNEENNTSVVMLHGNKIAEVGDDFDYDHHKYHDGHHHYDFLAPSHPYHCVHIVCF